MEAEYKIDVATHPREHTVTLLLNGKFGEDSLASIEQSVARAQQSRMRVYIDLSEVTLVDRKAVRYFSRKAGDGVTIVNCPVYLQGWIEQTNGDREY